MSDNLMNYCQSLLNPNIWNKALTLTLAGLEGLNLCSLNNFFSFNGFGKSYFMANDYYDKNLFEQNSKPPIGLLLIAFSEGLHGRALLDLEL